MSKPKLTKSCRAEEEEEDYTSVLFPSELLHGFKEPFDRSAAIPLPDNQLSSFLDNVEPPYAIEHDAGPFSPQCADNQQ